MKISALIFKTALVVIAIAALLYAAMATDFFHRPDQGPFPLTTYAAPMDLESVVLATGIIKPIDQVNVGTQVNGRINTILVGVGDKVKKGQLLAEIDPALQENSVQKAQASLSSVLAQKEAKMALWRNQKSMLARQVILATANAGTQAELEKLRTDLEITTAELNVLDSQLLQAKIDVQTAEENLRFTKITAPIDGEIMFIVAQVGQTVVSAQSSPTILVMGNLDKMRVKAQISEADIAKVKEKQSIYFTVLGLPDRKFTAELQTIETIPESAVLGTPGQSQAAIYYNGIFDIANPERLLKPSMTAQVRIVQETVQHALALPINALRKKLQRPHHYHVQILTPNNNLEMREVEIGIKTDLYVQIVKGLRQGERIVLHEDQTHPGSDTGRTAADMGSAS